MAHKEYGRGNPAQLVREEILSQIIISEDQFIKLYKVEFGLNN
jgi:hypothetical protein